MMGVAMLKRHRFVRSLWTSYGVPFGTGNRWPKCVRGESGAALVSLLKTTGKCLALDVFSKLTKCSANCHLANDWSCFVDHKLQYP